MGDDGAMTTESRPIDLLVRPEAAAVRSVWIGEATDFTPWLKDNLDWLDVLGLGPLELVGVEVPIPDVGRSLDILARTPANTLVAIENQFSKTDHDHLTRGLAYAVGLEAGALVVIAEDHRREFVAVADYLNTAYEELGPNKGIAVFLVKLAVEKVGGHYVPRFEIVSRPNTWLAEIQVVGSVSTRTVTGFLESCPPESRDRLAEILDNWTRTPGASIRLNPNSASVSLDYPYSPRTGHRSLYVVYSNDTMTVNRGYLRESVIDDTLVAEMDRRLAASFPRISDKPYYPTVREPQPAALTEFAQWVFSIGGTVAG